MKLHLLTPLAVAAVALAAGAVGSASTTATPTLKGTVGPGFTISLKSGGKTVKTLRAGTYKFAISDKANIHNFVIEKEKGGKFEKTLTCVGFVGSKTATIKLTKGTWKYYCAPHESTMHGEFKVT
jgi:plastocyanin